MTYYIKLPTDPDDVFQYDAGILGEASKKAFYPNKGFARFVKIAEDAPDIFNDAIILDETSKKYTPEEFLKKISKLKIIVNTHWD